jgi:hypothetical protein
MPHRSIQALALRTGALFLALVCGLRELAALQRCRLALILRR